MLPLVNSEPPDFVIIGTPGERRIDLFQAALSNLGLPQARMVSYLDLLAGSIALSDVVRPDSIVRIESPGKNFAVEQALLAFGAEVEDAEGDIYKRLPPEVVQALSDDKGRILSSRQWYLGYCRLLRSIEPQIARNQLMNYPADIMLMFDKRRCHTLLSQQGIAVPPGMDAVHSYDELIEGMLKRNWRRAFIKMAHGSSASGVVAYRFDDTHHQAITTVEMVHAGTELRLYNSRRIHVYSHQHEIATLINALCQQRVHVEQWIPKAGYAHKIFDLRVVVIAGQAQHIVVRLSQSPMTNLHLLNERGDAAAVLSTIGAERWTKARQSCERAARLFESLYTGIDLLFTPNFRQHALVEMNAFGDLLPGVLYNEQDTYTAEIVASLKAGGACSTFAT